MLVALLGSAGIESHLSGPICFAIGEPPCVTQPHGGDWVCALLDRQAGPGRTARCLAQARRRTGSHLHGSQLHWQNRARPGLDQALAAVRSGDTLVVPKLDRLARSVPDARAVADALVARGVKLALGSSVYDPADPMGKMFFNILATFAEFEADLIRLRTREGMAVARA